MRISVIATVKNEGESLRALLDSLVCQTLSADQLLICDGGSTDNTLDILREYQTVLPLTILLAPKSNISMGRNHAIAAANGEIIAATDAGVVLSPDWIDEITRPIRTGKAEIVAGWFEAAPQTFFEQLLGATTLPAVADINPATFLPSSRSVAFTKKAWERVGGYPEQLDYCEDLIFDFNLRREYGAFAFAPLAVAYFRPRPTLRAFAKQYYLYARGDGKADLWRKRHAIRYATYLVALPFLIALFFRKPLVAFTLLMLGVGGYCGRALARYAELSHTTPFWKRLIGFALIPIVRATGDLAKMAGYPIGWWWRLNKNEGVVIN